MMERDIYLIKAEESAAGASSEYANGRYNNVANRCYYACFQAATHALMSAGLRPSGARPTWSHEQVQALFAGELIRRRKVYPSTLRDVLSRTYLLRETADYAPDLVGETQASRALRRTQQFVEDIATRGGGAQ